MKRGKRLEIYGFVMHRTRCYWIIERKPNFHVLILGSGSCNFQTCFRGGSVIFVPKGRGGPCVFLNFINHISKCYARPAPPPHPPAPPPFPHFLASP